MSNETFHRKKKSIWSGGWNSLIRGGCEALGYYGIVKFLNWWSDEEDDTDEDDDTDEESNAFMY